MQRQECRPAQPALLQIIHRRLGCLLIFGDNILQRLAQSRFNRGHICVRHGNQLGHRTKYAFFPGLGAAKHTSAAKAEPFVGALHRNQYFSFRQVFLALVRQLLFTLLLFAQIRLQRFAFPAQRCLLAFQRLQQSGLLLQLDFLGPQQIPGCLVFVGKRVHFTVETVLLLGQILNLAFSLAQIVSLINDFLQLVENQIPRFMNLLLQIFDCRRLLFQ